ncbi:hypothetical protein BHE74_00010016 [Ensete ventricosum]|nr:hypothetical protein BHE74_00010016 [Ensete ventricosum]
MGVRGHIACLVSRSRSTLDLFKPRRPIGEGAYYYPYQYPTLQEPEDINPELKEEDTEEEVELVISMCVGSSPRVLRVCQDGAREFTRRRPRLTGRLWGIVEKLVRRLTITGAMKLQPNDGPRLSLGIGPGSDDVVGSPMFDRRFTEGIRKLTGNTSGDRQKKTGRLIARMSKAVGLAGVRS